jgi:predicted transcriptional regulator
MHDIDRQLIPTIILQSKRHRLQKDRTHKLTQQRLAESLGVGQDQICKLEQRSDLLLSTLRSYIEAMGGKLTIMAEFPKHKPVLLSGIAALENRP